MPTWYAGSTKHAAVAQWAASTAYTAGQLVRQLAAPAVGSERVFVCVADGTSGASEPAWGTTKGAKTTDGGATWQECTGRAGLNGDAVNTSAWAAGLTRALGDVIKDVAGTRLYICTTAGISKSGSEPVWNPTAGATTTDNTVTWTALGLASGFAPFAAPAARLNVFCATGFFSAVGDTVYVSHNHAETQASAIAYQATSSGGNPPTNIICVNDAAAPPTALATTASVTTTGANGLSYGFGYYTYGLNFVCASGASSSATLATCFSTTTTLYERCSFTLATTGTGTITTSGGAGAYTAFADCAFAFGAAGHGITVGIGVTEIVGGSVAATGTLPTAAFQPAAFSQLTVSGCDLSAVTGNLTNAAGAVTQFHNCALNAAVTVCSTTPSTGGPAARALIHNCDSGATSTRSAVVGYQGTLVSETAIVRTGGASNGTTGFSVAMTSRATARYTAPLRSDEIVTWNDTAGAARTATVELTTDAALTDAECWLEVEYPASAGSPLSGRASTRVGLVAAPSALTASAAAWGGAAKTYKYKLAAGFTPQMKGPVKARVFLARPSVTVYLDPLVALS